MKHSYKVSLFLLIILIAGCDLEKKTKETTGQNTSGFAKGQDS